MSRRRNPSRLRRTTRRWVSPSAQPILRAALYPGYACCFERIGANSIFICLEGNEERRQAIAQDLAEKLDPPCNSDRSGVCDYPSTECPLVWPLGL
ncbi:MAG: hypothetical protein HXX10_00935 [Rhodoplanes sp.]|uniref:hypothetical protein n=1 Tax=Rhodoplanes sp. TaxID=1968906 RepID=UPI00181242E4|nr:hypothetical protein [Rhodoplanes sp.]NVO12579.1 hypothetical protein [Rhodoplanes sp.]